MDENLTDSNYPAIAYLRDILGIRAGPKMANTSYDVMVRTSRPLNGDEKQLAEKMLAAIDCHKILWMSESGIDTEWPRRVVIFGDIEADIKKESGSIVLQLPDISNFFGTEEGVRELKKSAWEKLKGFKRAIENE